jgi:hypothetical protein
VLCCSFTKFLRDNIFITIYYRIFKVYEILSLNIKNVKYYSSEIEKEGNKEMETNGVPEREKSPVPAVGSEVKLSDEVEKDKTESDAPDTLQVHNDTVQLNG